MKSAIKTVIKSHHLPRIFIILMLGLIIVTFVVGTLRDFSPAQAGDPPDQAFAQPSPTAPALLPTPTPFILEGGATPTPVFEASADTTGIIAMAMVVVAVTLLGVAWGLRGSPPPRKKRAKKTG
jgi:hypothetical protein